MNSSVPSLETLGLEQGIPYWHQKALLLLSDDVLGNGQSNKGVVSRSLELGLLGFNFQVSYQPRQGP